MRLSKYAKRKVQICAIVISIIVLLALLIEIVGFNFNIITLPKSDRGVHTIEAENLELTDLTVESDGSFSVAGPAPSFKVNNIGYVSYLRIGTVEDSSPIHVFPSGQKGKYDVDYEVKEATYVFAGQDAEDVSFSVSVDDGNASFKMKDLAVVNNLVINWLRVYAMISAGILIAYFALFKKVASTKIHVTFLVVALILGSNIAVMMPKSYSYDEREHYIRSYQLSRFDLGINDNSIAWIEEIEEFFEYAGAANSEHNSYLERENFIERFDETEYPKVEHYHSTAVTYPFIPYVFQALGIFLARFLGMSFVYTFYAGRLFGLLGYAVVCYFAIKYAKVGKRLMAVLALLPSMIYTASAYSADPMTMAFSLLSFSILQNMIYTEKENKKLDYKLPLLYSLCIAMVVMCKITYVPICIMILAVPGSRFVNRKKEWITKILVIGVCGFVAIGTFIFGSIQGINQWNIPGADTVGQVKFILFNLPAYIGIMWNHIANHMIVCFAGSSTALAYSGDLAAIWTFSAVAMMFVAMLTECNSNSLYNLKISDKVLLVAAVVGSWVLVLTALYISFTPVGHGSISGVQGRYFAPLIFPLLLALKPQKVDCHWSPAKTNIAMSAGSCILLLVTIVKLFQSYCS